MLSPSLILVVAVTTARADNNFALVSPCVVREGQCDSTVLDNTGGSMTVDNLQQCADECKGNDACSAFQFEQNPPLTPRTCRMYDSAELPFHPDHLGGSSSDSAYEAAPVICGLCAKGPKATEAWRNNGKYCFSDVDCEDPPTYENEGFYCFTSDQTLVSFPFDHEGRHFSPIASNGVDGTSQCLRGDTLEDCEHCEDLDQRSGANYVGFPVKNNADTNKYMRVTNSECQKLCRKTPGCFYYNYEQTAQSCWLKYGIGTLATAGGENRKFGHKNSHRITDCEYYWTDWSDCSVDCGGGVRTREMIIMKNPDTVGAKYRGIACPAVQNQIENCNEHLCIVDCEYELTPNNLCNATCGGGWREEFIITRHSENGGTPCPENQLIRCNEDPCRVDCEVFRTPDSNCNATCGGGWRKTFLISQQSENGGTPCPEDQFVRCNEDPCTVDCEVDWTPNSPCDATCGGGWRKRFNIRRQPENDGTACPEDQFVRCNEHICPIDCEFQYTPNSRCNATCGGGWREGYIITQAPTHNGIQCPSSQTIPCNEHPCPIPCEFEWNPTTPCSATCGGGWKSTTYNITQFPQNNGTVCPANQTEECNTEACPVNCTFEWSAWSNCSVSCGDGERTRIPENILQNPEGLGKIRVKVGTSRSGSSHTSHGTFKLRLYDGNNAQARRSCLTGSIDLSKLGWVTTKDLGDCNNWATTQQWLTVHTEVVSTNDAYIGGLEFYTVEDQKIFTNIFFQTWGGRSLMKQEYHMRKLNITIQGTPCPIIETENCSLGCCPVDCLYEETQNASCTVPCGGGRMTRYKILRPAECNGTACPEYESEVCNTEPCDCQFQFREWTACSETCGPGIRKRNPNITRLPTEGGQQCPTTEVEKCNEGSCISVAGIIAGGLFVLVVAVGGGGGYWFFKSRKIVVKAASDHIVLQKNENLKETLEVMAEDNPQLFREFRQLELEVSQIVQDSTANSQKEMNKKHNRYIDIVPFDKSGITISKELGKPSTKYINASMITFKDYKQRFIAAQAPKERISFQNFWQMILENKVGVVVMITALTEKGRKKADQYWPDGESEVLNIGAGITLEHKSSSYQGTFYHRVINVKRPNKPPVEVSQLQTLKWADLTAPDDTKILRDLVQKASDLNPGKEPIVVHCSAGVGRTGTFIAVYKLLGDYHDQNKHKISPYSTVMEMRRCRMKTVQKKEQYAYIFKCLRDEVKFEEGDYYKAL